MLCAQEQEFSQVKESQYLEAKDKLGYDKTKRVLVLRDRFKALPKEKKRKGSGLLNSLGLLRLLAYVLVIVLIIVILYMVFNNIKIDKDVKVHDDVMSDEIENIEEIDADAEYKAALANGNYRLAIRMMFIKSLQKLSANNLIEWEKEKTNRDYTRELNDVSLRQSFRRTASIYELVWYGDVELDVQRFRAYDTAMNKFNNSIG